MREQPQAEDLLHYAREVLLQEIIPALPKELRLTGFMIANAMGIATRQMQNGDEHDYMELNDLTELIYNLGYEPASLSTAIEAASTTKATTDATLGSKPHKATSVSSHALLSSGLLSHTQLQETLTLLNHQLAQLIRNRKIDDQQDLVAQHLERASAIRAAESGG